mgnify:CR=1 FL=1
MLVASEAAPLPAISLAEVLATSDVPGGVVNVLTGYTAELQIRKLPGATPLLWLSSETPGSGDDWLEAITVGTDDGTFTIHVDGSDMQDVDFRAAKWDFQVTSPGGVIRTLFFQQLLIWHCGQCPGPLPDLLSGMVDLLLDGIAGPRWRQSS